jgi:hypothetical protein
VLAAREPQVDSLTLAHLGISNRSTLILHFTFFNIDVENWLIHSISVHGDRVILKTRWHAGNTRATPRFFAAVVERGVDLEPGRGCF